MSQLRVLGRDFDCHEEGCRPPLRATTPTTLGTGWNTYTLTASPADRTLVGRDRDGVLWQHRSERGKLLPRTKVGGGWQKYTHIAPAGLNGGGVADLFAIGPSGSAMYYGRDSTGTPFGDAFKVPVNGDSTTYKSVF
ncbi:hypothetical protein [Streptomyces hydrogenans]|uniref:hypothetical protein n=1 Tax=Streptomyces hydrogenans TaxID=1873719 RepID=UPI0035E0B478